MIGRAVDLERFPAKGVDDAGDIVANPIFACNRNGVGSILGAEAENEVHANIMMGIFHLASLDKMINSFWEADIIYTLHGLLSRANFVIASSAPHAGAE